MGQQPFYSLRLQSAYSKRDALNVAISSAKNYQQRINYISFDFKNDIVLKEGNDTLKCHLFHLERSYSPVPYVEFILKFDASKGSGNGDKSIIIHNQILGRSPIELVIFQEAILHTPDMITYAEKAKVPATE